jgi:hypothetical protein
MSFLAVFFYVVVGAASILAGIDAGLGLRRARRPVTVIVLVLAIALLLSLLAFPLHGLVLLVVALTALLLIGLIVEFATAGAGRRRPLTIVAAVVTVLALLSLWPVVGLTVG